MNSRTIFIDIDGVIAAYDEAYIQHVFKDLTMLELESMISKIVKWDSLLEITNTTFEQLKEIQRTKGFVYNIEKYNYADIFIGSIVKTYKSFFNIAFLTAVSSHEREDWVDTHYPTVPLVMSKDKWLMAKGNILVDDNDTNIQKWETHGGYGILFPRRYNMNRELANNPLKYTYQKLGEFSGKLIQTNM